MKHLSITEVGLRDGLQNELEFLTTESNNKLATRLIKAGVRKLELEQDGFNTDIDLNALIDAGKYLSGRLKRELPEHMQPAAPVGKTYELKDAAKARG